MGLEEGFLSRFRIPARRMSEYQTLGQVLSQLPRYVLEAIAFGGIIALILVLIIRDEGGLVAMLPTLGLVAMAGTRLFPALQKVFHSISSMRFGEPALDALYKDIMEVSPAVSDAARLRKPRPPMELRDTLALEAASFTYPEAPRPALDAMTLEIPANHTIGIVGGTGAGKTSVVDVILGLLTLQSGALRVDGHAVTDEDIRAWQKNIGYVPQQIFLADDTVSANIAFGTPAEKIDQAAVERAARIAELHDFVTETLPEGYDTRVGERGVKLSGGQRQRIGIARALYHDPGVLILDEATSALDNLTEQAVMEAVHNLGRQKTIIMIAHRLSTVKACDRIFYLEAGRVAQSGTYDELVSESAGFRAMSEAG
jgi:ABC-type multidrug transport system fused ATPase/permease subunit